MQEGDWTGIPSLAERPSSPPLTAPLSPTLSFRSDRTSDGKQLTDKQKLQIVKKECLRLRAENEELMEKVGEADKLKAKVKRTYLIL